MKIKKKKRNQQKGLLFVLDSHTVYIIYNTQNSKKKISKENFNIIKNEHINGY